MRVIPFLCSGCELGHVADALILIQEARKFERESDRKMADRHLLAAMGSLKEAEAQAPTDEHKARIREVRKLMEGAIASGQPIPDVAPELEQVGLETLDLLRKHPELCPTCRVERGIEHV